MISESNERFVLDMYKTHLRSIILNYDFDENDFELLFNNAFLITAHLRYDKTYKNEIKLISNHLYKDLNEKEKNILRKYYFVDEIFYNHFGIYFGIFPSLLLEIDLEFVEVNLLINKINNLAKKLSDSTFKGISNSGVGLLKEPKVIYNIEQIDLYLEYRYPTYFSKEINKVGYNIYFVRVYYDSYMVSLYFKHINLYNIK